MAYPTLAGFAPAPIIATRWWVKKGALVVRGCENWCASPLPFGLLKSEPPLLALPHARQGKRPCSFSPLLTAHMIGYEGLHPRHRFCGQRVKIRFSRLRGKSRSLSKGHVMRNVNFLVAKTLHVLIVIKLHSLASSPLLALCFKMIISPRLLIF